MKTEYIEFLRSKIPQAEICGFEPPCEALESLFPHQRDVAKWACIGGRRAVFASFGLGKTRIHLQLAQWVTMKTGGMFLIIAPLGVRQEFTKSDGPALGMQIPYVRTNSEIDDAVANGSRVLITNYERVRDGDIDPSQFAGVGLDEGSILRSFGSKTYQEFSRKLRGVKYRFVFTATPAPNEYRELINYAGFLGVMDTGQALTRFFQRNSSEANDLTLYPHMERQFWIWVSSWACFITKPSDIGYSDEGYDLPEMEVIWEKVNTDHRAAWGQTDSWGQRQLIRDEAAGLAATAEVKRDSITQRLDRAIEIIAEESNENWLIWHDLEREREAIEKRIEGVVTVYGSQDLELRENRIMGFARGEYMRFATKPSIAGSGCNFQRHCARAIFLGTTYKFNELIQAIHRIYRFQQKRKVKIHIIYQESEAAVVAALKRKWADYNRLMETMTELLKTNKLTNMNTLELIRTLTEGQERAELKGSRFRLVKNDSILEFGNTELHPDNSVHEIVTSIPFGNQYEYSPSYNDLGHNTGDDAFFKQLDFLVPNLLRVLKPGRVACIHVKDRIRFGNVTGIGFPSVGRFSDKTADCFERHGFHMMARITIDTDVVRENAQTYRLGWSENAKDSSKMGAGMPEYVLVFRKAPSDMSDGYADEPVTKSKEDYTRADWQLDAAGLWRSNGNRLPDPELMKHMPMDSIRALWRRYSVAGGYSHEEHVAICRALEQAGNLPSGYMLFPPVSRKADIWDDINRMVTLNTELSARNIEKHVCPLQLDIIERCIRRYSNEGEIILDPFMGVGSTAVQALKMKRKALGCELNADYWKVSAAFCERQEADLEMPTLFDIWKE